MATFSASATRPVRRGAPAALVLVLALLAALVPFAAFVPPAAAAPRLDVVLSGRFDGPEHTGVLAATVSPKAFSSATLTPPPTLPVILTAGCTDAAPCNPGEGTLVSWDFGDGSRIETDKLAVAHPYREPGVYTVRVRVSTKGGVGEDEITVLVSPRYADADADLADKPGRRDREAIWAASALGLLGPCRPAFPSLDGVDPASTDVNRGVFCPEPTSSYGPSGVAPTMPEAATGNGLTDESCLARADACGLPVEYFATSGDPTSACNSACVAALRSEGLLDSSNRLVYDPANCVDGWSAGRSNGSWRIVPGLEPGCVSRSEFYRSLVLALDGQEPTSASLLADADLCTDSSTSPGMMQMRRAAALGLPVTHTRGGQPHCDGAMSVSKSEVYHALSRASGLPEAPPSGLRDLSDRNLSGSGASAHPHAASIGGLLSKGTAVVGLTSCADGSGRCFNPGEGVTRSQLSSLLAGLFVGMPSLASGLQIGISPSANPMSVGSSVELLVQVLVPASYPSDAKLTVAWPPVSNGVSSRSCPDTQQVTAGSERTIELTCSYRRVVAGTSALAVSVTDESGNRASASVPLIATNASPVLSEATVPTFDEDTRGQVVVTATDPEDTPLKFNVRTALPSADLPSRFPLTGRTPTLSWKQEAEVAVGKVRVVSVKGDAATIEVVPDANVYGPYSFAVEVCDNSTCSSQTVTGVVEPVNDAPRPRTLVGASGTFDAPLTVRLSGSDPADQGREGYTGIGIDLYRIESLPSRGVLRYDADPGEGENYVAATVGATTNNPVVRFVPSASDDDDDAVGVFTYSVRDTGFPGPKWSSRLGVALVHLHR